jgi:flagellar assembly protein FliH
MDSMLLMGIVRVALDRLEENTSAVLRVPVAEGDGWKNALANLPKPPKLVEDLRLRSGDCVLESQMGTIELGIGAQLEEIRRGFFDLLREAPTRRGGDARDAAPSDGRTPGAAS